ncbi:MAG: hypothetical protein KGO96_05110 [Elusimicrobia bacterium]|nr:hypothetical protein [Elusimicrobiota bacterium]MDE2236914.1 hypothetical protein [Elusimicrobiota bacterium]MDE2425270.1 hypothetical protein [Elusimicrobiota bacterium]
MIGAAACVLAAALAAAQPVPVRDVSASAQASVPVVANGLELTLELRSPTPPLANFEELAGEHGMIVQEEASRLAGALGREDRIERKDELEKEPRPLLARLALRAPRPAALVTRLHVRVAAASTEELERKVAAVLESAPSFVEVDRDEFLVGHEWEPALRQAIAEAKALAASQADLLLRRGEILELDSHQTDLLSPVASDSPGARVGPKGAVTASVRCHFHVLRGLPSID